MKSRTAAARRRRQRWGVVFRDCCGGVYGPPVILDGLQVYRNLAAISEAARRFAAIACMAFDRVLQQVDRELKTPRGSHPAAPRRNSPKSIDGANCADPAGFVKLIPPGISSANGD